MLSIIVAIAKNNCIGINNQMPWHIPEDFAHFKKITMGHTVVMGEKTFESIGKPLPGRKNIIITLLKNYHPEGVDVIHGLDELFALAQGDDEVFVIGGATIYKLTLPYADRLYLTRVNITLDGDAFFPQIDFENDFEIVEEGDVLFSAKQGLEYQFVVAERAIAPPHNSADTSMPM
ncbi:MAG: dihydrofolate reductase [uncultured bacterium]|nr:MAG: dihydrofolate reductase [uncultured bacterium]HLD44744.1 dihydrofolate reductase [bacterium]